jgi:3-phenylpropionate/cinnamic acid dioxygenase small subunit
VTEQELRWLADQLELRSLVARTAQLADTGDLGDYALCFASDAVWVPPADAGVPQVGAERHGLDDILAGARERRAAGIQGPGSNTRHVVSTTTIEPLGPDHARGRSYWRYYGDTHATPRLLTMGHYDDEFVREDEGWRIRRRVTVRG